MFGSADLGEKEGGAGGNASSSFESQGNGGVVIVVDVHVGDGCRGQGDHEERDLHREREVHTEFTVDSFILEPMYVDDMSGNV